MALTVDWAAKVVYSDASITDLPLHHLALRDLEASEAGMLYDDICAWQILDLGGGATLPQIDYINGWQLTFPVPGSYTVIGNLNAPIIPTAGVYVERKTSVAFVTTAVGGSGPTAADIAAAMLAAAQASPIWADARQMNGHQIIGDGSEADMWRGAGVSP